MLKLLSDLIMAERLDLPHDGVANLSGYQGSWVTLDANSACTLTSGATGLAYPIWNESATKDESTQGFTSDVGETGKLTVLTGHHKAYTNQYDLENPPTAVGDSLIAGAIGVLRKAIGNDAAGDIIAVCTDLAVSVEYRGETYTCIQYETV